MATNEQLAEMKPASRRWKSWSSPIVRPSVTLVIPWVGLCALVLIFRVCVLKFPTDPEAVLRVVSSAELVAISVLNGLLLIALAFEARHARGSPRDLRAAHMASVALGMLVLIMLQVGAVLAWGPFQVP